MDVTITAVYTELMSIWLPNLRCKYKHFLPSGSVEGIWTRMRTGTVMVASSLTLVSVSGLNQNLAHRLVVDSNMTRTQALGKNHFPSEVLARMEVVAVTYHGFDGRRHQGQIVVDRAIAKEVKTIFDEIETTGYPITKVVPIVVYGWSDDASIADNNTSAFNYRHVIGPGQNTHKLSHHSFGRAIDINPKINPFVSASGKSERPYDPSNPGTLTFQSKVTQIFLRHGWTWGGSWVSGKDYQHFEKMS